MELLCSRHGWWVAQCDAVLQAEGIPAHWREGPHGRVHVLEVDEADAGRVVETLSEVYADDRLRPAEPRARVPEVPLLLQPAVALALGSVLMLLAFYALSGPWQPGSPWHELGAYIPERVDAGQWWRRVTAATLHADLPHVAGNVAFGFVMLWATAERLGGGVALLVMLVSAVLGFEVSALWDDGARTVGASGGVFGLLGASMAHGLRDAAAPTSWRPRWRLRVAGAALLFLGFTAFGERANVAAHLGGFAAGAVLGGLWPLSLTRVGWQLFAGLLAAVSVAAAWASAWGRL